MSSNSSGQIFLNGFQILFPLSDSQTESITGGINGVVLSYLGTKPKSSSPSPAPVPSPGPFPLPVGLPGINLNNLVPASFAGLRGFPFV